MEYNNFLLGISCKNSHPNFTNRNVSINDFTVGKLLGKGGFGNVYAAQYRLSPDRSMHVALKIMNKSKILEARMVNRVRNEVEIHSRLHHPSILQLYHFLEDTHNVYLVMEMCPNGELYRYIQTRAKFKLPPMSEAEIRQAMMQVIRGVEYLQRNSIIHRDLKLSNMLLTKEFDIKIADFGLAVTLDNADGEQLTMCGTPNYISPEIVERKPYGMASDLWSIGCMFYTMIVGKPPFESSVVSQTLGLVSKAHYDIPSTVSNEASDFIKCVLQKDPGQRITVGEMLQHKFFKFPSFPLKDIYRQQQQPDETTKSELPSFSTARLKPLKQETKSGNVELLASGDLVLDFNEDKYRIVLNGDGSSISFYSKPVRDDRPTHVCTRKTIPDKYRKRYLYAWKFVSVLRSKTPMITYFSPQAKCLFMDNAPFFDFDVLFYPGRRIQWLQSRQEVLFKDQQQEPQKISITQKYFSTSVEILSFGQSLEAYVPQNFLSQWKHAIDCYKQCWEIMRQQPLDKFPLFLKTKMAQKENVVDNMSSHVDGDDKMSIHLTDFQSVNGSPTVLAQSSRFSTVTSTRKPMDLHSSTMTSQQVSTRIFPKSPSPTSSSLQSIKYVFLDGVGWCIRKFNECSSEFALMFNDGTRLIIEQSTNDQLIVAQVRFYVQGREECFKIDRNLPQNVKEKLAYFPSFVELFQQ